jgi:hypothetical protein
MARVAAPAGRERRTFVGCVFWIDESYGRTAPVGFGLSEVCELLTQHGGRYFDHVPARPPQGAQLFVLCPALGWAGPSKALGALPSLSAVTYFWVQQCIRDQCMHALELKLLFAPLASHFPLVDATSKAILISTTGFQPREKAELEVMVAAMGAGFADRLSRKQCTHLLCASDSVNGDKFVKAKEWGIECASRQWIEACVRVGAWVDISAYRVAGASGTDSRTPQQRAPRTQGSQGSQVRGSQAASTRWAEASSDRSSFPSDRPGALLPKPVAHHPPQSKENTKNGASHHALDFAPTTRVDAPEASAAVHAGGDSRHSLLAGAKPSQLTGTRKRDREGTSAGERERSEDSFGVEGVPAAKSALVPEDLKELANTFGEEIKKRRRMHGPGESQGSSGSGSQADKERRLETAGGVPSCGSQQALSMASLGRQTHAVTHERPGSAHKAERSTDLPIAGVASSHADANGQGDDGDSAFAEVMRSLRDLPANAPTAGSAYSIFGRRSAGGAERPSLSAIRKAWPALPRRRTDAGQDGSSAGSHAQPSPKVHPSPPTTVLPRAAPPSAYGEMGGDGEVESTQNEFAVVYRAAGDQIDHAALVDQTHSAAADGSVTSTQIDREVDAMCIPASSLDPVGEEDEEDELRLRNSGASTSLRLAPREVEHPRSSAGMNSVDSTPDFHNPYRFIMLTNWTTAAPNASGTKGRGAAQGSKAADAACVQESEFQATEAVERLRELGAHVEDSPQIDARCTHLVTSCPASSEKYLGALAAGAWILRPSFVHASVLARGFVAEEGHEWNGETIDVPASSVVDQVRLDACVLAWHGMTWHGMAWCVQNRADVFTLACVKTQIMFDAGQEFGVARSLLEAAV